MDFFFKQKKTIGASIRINQEIRCLPYAGLITFNLDNGLNFSILKWHGLYFEYGQKCSLTNLRCQLCIWTVASFPFHTNYRKTNMTRLFWMSSKELRNMTRPKQEVFTLQWPFFFSWSFSHSLTKWQLTLTHSDTQEMSDSRKQMLYNSSSQLPSDSSIQLLSNSTIELLPDRSNLLFSDSSTQLLMERSTQLLSYSSTLLLPYWST